MKNSKMYITSTISPMMLAGPKLEMIVQEFEPEDMLIRMSGINTVCKSRCVDVVGAVGHQNTASVIRPLVERYLPEVSGIELFDRVSIKLGLFDEILAIIPNFRANEAREFTFNEVENAGFRVFYGFTRKRIPYENG